MTTHILLRSSWQTANIGDVAHSPGALRAFAEFGTDVRLTLWPVWLDERERAMFARYLPDVEIVEGALDDDGVPDTTELTRAWDEADVLVHGSGPSPLQRSDVAAWSRATGKPYGFFGVTFDPFDVPQPQTLAEIEVMIDALPPDYLQPELRELLDGAAFVYCRDSLSARYLTQQGVASATLGFGPDATFAFDLYDHDAAARTLADIGLGERPLLCVIPALRWTPYYRLRGYPASREERRRDAVNELYTASDMLPLREGITAWVREHRGDVLVCAEMIHEVELGKQWLTEGYPADVQPRVHHLDRYWDVTEAAAVYARSAGVLGHECHSPILASTVGVPALYVREPCDTVKGRMYADVGMPGSQIEVERDGTPAVRSWLRQLAHEPGTLQQRARDGHATARARLAEMVKVAVTAAHDQVPVGP